MRVPERQPEYMPENLPEYMLEELIEPMSIRPGGEVLWTETEIAWERKEIVDKKW